MAVLNVIPSWKKNMLKPDINISEGKKKKMKLKKKKINNTQLPGA